MSSARRPTTYSHRKKRSKAQNNVSMSSPLRNTDSEEIPRSEMSARMKKRARQTINNTHFPLSQEQDLAEATRKPKRMKRTPASQNDHGIHDITLAPAPLLHDFTIPLKGSDIASISFQTPHHVNPPKKTPSSSSGFALASSALPEPLSPLPRVRRMLSRTSSRNLKENSGSIKSLASPFHSRSASKAGSPKKKKTKKPAFYTKARTLSDANACNDQVMKDDEHVPINHSVLFDSPRSLRRSTSHDRFSVHLPSTNMFDHLSEEVWFRPPKALSRSPFDENILPAETPLPDWSYDTSAFFGDVPQGQSTPLDKRGMSPRSDSPGEGTPSAPNTPELNGAGDVVMKDALPESVANLRRRTLHYSKDSIFSSSFSDSTSAGVSLPPALGRGSHAAVTAPRSVPGSPANIAGAIDQLLPERIPTPCSSPAAEELTGMLNGMGIDEGRTAGSPYLPPHRSRSLDSAALSGVANAQAPAKNEPTRRRDRAGTIRASDFGQKTANVPTRAPVAHPGGGYTRTRSGTIRPTRPPMHTRINSEPSAAPITAARDDSPDSDDPLDLLKSPFSEDKTVSPASRLHGKARIPAAVKKRASEIHQDVCMEVASDGSDDPLVLLEGKGWSWEDRWG
ncbi:hypothetical protein DENSPDRAFT_927731 [Dentipellis sp. KUC8613]|nr:hypothetical protein DENSPDRAFT_927731 [Dentipellis sp. KUC8613]